MVETLQLRKPVGDPRVQARLSHDAAAVSRLDDGVNRPRKAVVCLFADLGRAGVEEQVETNSHAAADQLDGVELPGGGAVGAGMTGIGGGC